MYKVNAPCVLLSVLLFLLMGEARAFTCITSDGGVIGAGGSEEPLPVRIRVSRIWWMGKTALLMLVRFIVRTICLEIIYGLTISTLKQCLLGKLIYIRSRLV